MRHEKTCFFAYVNTKVRISCAENRAADQCLYFPYIDSKIPPLPKPPAIFCDCKARFVSDLVGNPEDRFSHNAALIPILKTINFTNCTGALSHARAFMNGCNNVSPKVSFVKNKTKPKWRHRFEDYFNVIQ